MELLKAVSLFVCAFEAQERFSVGRAMLREFDEMVSVHDERIEPRVSTDAMKELGASETSADEIGLELL
jgi:hypothetical protein